MKMFLLVVYLALAIFTFVGATELKEDADAALAWAVLWPVWAVRDLYRGVKKVWKQ